MCSTSLRLFRASTQLGSDSGATDVAPAMQPLSRQLSAFDQSSTQQQQQQQDPRAPGVAWNVTVRSHAEYDAQGQCEQREPIDASSETTVPLDSHCALRLRFVQPSSLAPRSICWTRSATPVKCSVVSAGV